MLTCGTKTRLETITMKQVVQRLSIVTFRWCSRFMLQMINLYFFFFELLPSEKYTVLVNQEIINFKHLFSSVPNEFNNYETRELI